MSRDATASASQRSVELRCIIHGLNTIIFTFSPLFTAASKRKCPDVGFNVMLCWRAHMFWTNTRRSRRSEWHCHVPGRFISAPLWRHKGLIYVSSPTLWKVKQQKKQRMDFPQLWEVHHFGHLRLQETRPHPLPLLIFPVSMRATELHSIQITGMIFSSVAPFEWERKIKALLSRSWVGLIKEKYEGLCVIFFFFFCVAPSCTVRILKAYTAHLERTPECERKNRASRLTSAAKWGEELAH